MKEVKYCYSWDKISYTGEYATKEELVKECLTKKPEAKYVYIGTCKDPTFKWDNMSYEITGSMYENLYDDVGDVVENFEVSDEDRDKLDKMVNEAIKKWIKQNNIKPSCYMVINVHKAFLNNKKEIQDTEKEEYMSGCSDSITQTHNLLSDYNSLVDKCNTLLEYIEKE